MKYVAVPIKFLSMLRLLYTKAIKSDTIRQQVQGVWKLNVQHQTRNNQGLRMQEPSSTESAENKKNSGFEEGQAVVRNTCLPCVKI